MALTTAAVCGRASAGDVLPFVEGRAHAPVSEDEARRAGLTLVDLGSSFVPPVFSDEPALGELGKLPYAEAFRALADERFGDVPEAPHAAEARSLELYGIFPNLRVIGARLTDDARHACHAEIDDTPLRAYEGSLGPSALLDARPSPRARARRAAITVAQQHLACDGLLGRGAHEGALDAATSTAIAAFQRTNTIVARPTVDGETRSALLADSLERDFTALLRVLRERVVAATALIEDGSAAARRGRVLGRSLDAYELTASDAYGALPLAAEDLISPATEAAARALGWLSPAHAQAFFRAEHGASVAGLHVALPLPPAPSYHSAQMELRAEIDRGDVWYDYPYRPDGSRRAQPVARRPTLVLYARSERGDVPLVRWSTTIGGFQPELTPEGALVFEYKESEVGPRVWRQVVAAPAWLPPDSTPDAELVRRVLGGGYTLKREVFGPGFDSAYGLVMMPHELALRSQSGETSYVNHGIRTHGSVSYRSILHGESHGCHRLFNHLALRLASFLVSHRQHAHLGLQRARYRRLVRYRGLQRVLSIDTRGYVYELTPPIPIEVLEGRVRGTHRTPIRGAQPVRKGFRF